MSSMFSSSKLTTLDVSNFDTSKVTNMNYMFSNSAATEIKGLENFDTSNVKYMSRMFEETKATELNISNFNTSSATRMYRMFYNSTATILDVSNFDTSNVIDMSYMFYMSKVTTLDLSNFDTSKVTDMGSMFTMSYDLTTIYASDKFVTNKVTSSSGMFYGCSKLVGGAGTALINYYSDKTYARIDGGTDSPGYFTLKTN